MNHEDFLHRVLTSEEIKQVKHQSVLVALSGGADSVALLRFLLDARCDCKAAHCNFHLRGEESMRDEQFVRDLCNRLNVPLIVKDFDVAAYQREFGGSVEMACRELRYQWFEEERMRQKCDLIAVAHHADDQVETFFINLMRGTGIKGLTGMQRLSGHIWRPLLCLGRNEILDYLAAIGQDFVTDSTNEKNDFRRNRLRNIVLPVIEQQFPQATSHILDTMGNLSSDYELMISLVRSTIPNVRHVDIGQLLAHPDAPTLLYHRIRHLGFNRQQCLQAVEAASHGHAGRQFVGKGYQLVVNRHSIDIEAISTPQDIEIAIDLHTGIKAPVRVSISHGDIPFSPLMCDGKKKVAFNQRIFDCKRIVLRHWRQADRIKPYGLKGSKLVSDLFADFKLDHTDKQAIWLLEADGDILWVLGYRASSHYTVARESQDYILLTLDE